ncbi:tRNA(Glu)-specific nuclease WapA [Halioglobus japonicus]|nr:tRNA(Glu)-specific nuclease WapA [Halioglobus japonicus]
MKLNLLVLILTTLSLSGCFIEAEVTGQGTVTSTGGISCDNSGGAACKLEYTEPNVETITAIPDAGWTFLKWEQDPNLPPCADIYAPECVVTMTALQFQPEYAGEVVPLNAIFVPEPYQCNIMPIGVEESVLTALQAGDTATEIPINWQQGIVWLSWAGTSSVPVLANSLILPGDSDTYINPDDPADTELTPGDWVRGWLGTTDASAVQAALNNLLNVPIEVPVRDTRRSFVTHSEYHVVRYATIVLTEYRLDGNGWLTFTYLGDNDCANGGPVAQGQVVVVDEGQSVAITLVATDPENQPLTYTIVNNPANGSLSGTPPSVTYTPALDFSGTDTFHFYVDDGNSYSGVATVTINVLPINDAPVAFNQQLAFDEDTSVSLVLQWSDVDEDSVTVEVLTQPTNGTLAGSSDPFGFTYTPNSNFVGDDSFTFRVNDGLLDSNIATVTLTTNVVNDPPVAQDNSATTDEDEPVDISLVASDVDGDVLTYQILAAPMHGTAVFNSTNTVSYQPAPGYFGIDEFTFFTNDGQLDSNTATVTITVIEQNRPPQILSAAITQSQQRAQYSYPVQVYDPNAGDTLTYRLDQAPDGMAIDAVTGEVDWATVDDYVAGLDSVNSYCSVTAYDEQHRALDLVFLTDDSGQVTLPASALNSVVATAEAALVNFDIGAMSNANTYGLLTFGASTTAITVNGGQLFSSQNFPGASAQLAATSAGPADGLAALQAVLDQYTLRAPVAKHLVLGVDEIPASVDPQVLADLVTVFQAQDYTLSVIVDATFECDDGSLAWGVDANNVGYTLDQGEVTYCQNPTLQSGDPAVLSAYVDLALASGGSVWNLGQLQASQPDFEAAFGAYLSQSVVGSFTQALADLSIDSISLDPNDPLRATVIVRNRGLGAPGASTTLAIAGQSGGVEFPLANEVVGNLGGAEAVAFTVDLPSAHTFDAISAAVAPQPVELECAFDNNAMIAPLVAVVVEDEDGLTDEQHYAISVHEANDLPEIVSDFVSTAYIGNAYAYFVRATDEDKGDLVRFNLETAPEGMWIHPVSGKITWLPEASDSGDHPVVVVATDIAGATDTQSFSLAVDNLNHAPEIITTPVLSAQLGQLYFYDVNALDADGDTLTYSLLVDPGGAIDASTGVITWQASVAGMHQFSVQVSDGRGGFDSQQFLVSVADTFTNAPPAATPGSYQTPQNQLVDISLTGQDPNGDVLTFTITSLPQNGSLIGQGAEIQYLPDAFFAGTDSFEFTVDDGALGSLPAVITVDVTDQNNAPIITSEPELPFVLEPASGQGQPVDLTQWTVVELSSSYSTYPYEWVIDGTEAEQRLNANPTALLSEFNVANDQIEGEFQVASGAGDDDFIGFVFAYQNPYQYYVFDWKRSAQTTSSGNYADRGMTVRLVNLASDGSQGFPNLWQKDHPTAQILYDQPQTQEVAWIRGRNYQFTLTFFPGEFTITVREGASVKGSFTVQDDTFADGAFGFYNHSQERVKYRGFTREVLASREYLYQLEAYDPDGDPITYSLISGPPEMSLDPSGLLTWQTTSTDAGRYKIELEVSDPSGARATQTYDLVVVEEVPVITSDPVDIAIADAQYIYDVGAYDPNPDDVLIFSLEERPDGMLIDANSGVLSWSPTLTEIGPHNVKVRVTDSAGFYSEQLFELTVVQVRSNTAPEFTSTPPDSAFVGGSYLYTPSATDADGDSLSYSLVSVPAGMQMFDTENITWRPTADQVAQHTVVIEVADGNGGVTLQEYTINVTGVGANRAPSINSTPGQAIASGDTYEYQVQASDPDGHSLTYVLEQGPHGMEMDIHGLVTWLPVEVGYYSVTVRVDDAFGAYATQTFTIAVTSTLLNEAPEFTTLPAVSAFLDARYTYGLQATDNDGDSIVYSVVNGPEGLTIHPYTGLVDWVPSELQLGVHPVSLKAYDGRGGSVLQHFDLTVLALANNQPPTITSTPATAVDLGTVYTYQLTGQDPEGASLVFNLSNAPSGMTMTPAGLVSWQPEPGQEGLHSVIVSISDGAGGTATQTYILAVDDGSGYSGNLAPSINSVPASQVTGGTLYTYQIDATDPESGVLDYFLPDAPPAAMVDDNGLVSWATEATDIGTQMFVVEVSDEGGAIAQQQFSVSIIGTGVNDAPAIDNFPPTSAKVGLDYQVQILASDADGDALNYSLSVEPPGATISPTGLISWTPLTAGPEPITVRVDDGIQWTELGWDINVLPGGTPLSADITVTPEVVDAGDVVVVQIVPTGAAGDASVSITVDGANVALDGNNTASIVNNVIGAHEIAARIEDDYDTVTVRKTFYIRDPDDLTVPVATIDNITAGQKVTAPVEILATISDDNLSSWSLRLYSMDDVNNFVELATGTAAVSNAVVATLDPTMLLNGLYNLQLEALDTSRNTGLDSSRVILTGDMKVGNFSFTVTDLDIPLSGIPIQVNRTYDSRQRHQNLDFGYGWTLDYQNVKIEESRPISAGWSLNENFYGPFGAFVDYCVEPLGTPLVTITLPSGSVETFEVRATPECNQFIPIIDVEFDFVAVDGTTSTLEQTDYQTLRFTGGKLVEIAGDQQPDPDNYVLTTKAGFVYVLEQHVGIKTITDPNGNTLTYTDDGILHSDGKSVDFERDEDSGLITAIIDPKGQRYEYVRDGEGDLISMTDPENAVSTYTYNSNHGLLEMFDPLDRKLIKNHYDDDGRLTAQEDGDGVHTYFTHDIAGRQSTVTDRNLFATQLFYDDEGNVTSSVDPYGEITTFTYDADGNQTSQTNALGDTSSATFNDRLDQLTQTDELGNTVSFTYNQRGQELTVQDARLNTYTQIYDTRGNLLTVEDPQGNIAGNNINAKGLVSLTQDVAGNITEFTYDSAGNKLTEEDAEGHVTTYTYDDNGNVLTESRQRDGNNEVTTYTYDARDRLLTTLDAEGNLMSSEYDLAGNQVASVDAKGLRTEYVYDAYGRLKLTTYPDNTTESKSYDPEGNLTSSTDRKSRTTSYIYDRLNRLVKTTYPDSNFTETEYDAVGRVTAEIDERGNRTEHGYDAAGRRTSTTDAQGNIHSFEYDADGNLIAEVDALGRRTQYTYNNLDQRTQTLYHDGSIISESHDALGRRTSMTDQAGIATQYAYDGLGRLTGVTDTLNQQTTFSYDEAGNKLTQTDAESRITNWSYDAIGRTLTRVLPLGQSESLGYDEVGNLISRVDFNGQSTTVSYDNNHRLQSRLYADGSSESFLYDDVGNLIEVTQIAADTSTRVTTYGYDSRDRLTSTTQPNGATLSYGYDEASNKVSLTVVSPSGTSTTTTYSYDTLNRLQSVTDINGVTTYGYDAVGNQISVSHPNGSSQVYGYDDLNRLTVLKTFDGNGALVEQYDYTLHATGRRTAINELDGRTTTYGYDDLYRLTSETIVDAVNGDYSAGYSYDAVGNRTQSVIDGLTTAYTIDANDRLTQQGGTVYTYDANGNTLTSTLGGNTTTYSYDDRDKLASVDVSGVVTTYTYDHNGIRSSKTEAGTTTDFVVDENRAYAQVLEEITGSTTDVTYSYGHDLLSQDRSGASSFYHYDGLGSTRLLSDDLGDIADEVDYEAFGNVLTQNGSTENNYLFAGEQLDSTTNNYYLRARYYDPSVGRFAQMDSWMGIDPQPITLNKYIYGDVDPVSKIDPSGNFSLGSLGTASNIQTTLATAAIRAPRFFTAFNSTSVVKGAVVVGTATCFAQAVSSLVGNAESIAQPSNKGCELNKVRVQLQQGSRRDRTIGKVAAWAPNPGVSVNHVRAKLNQLYFSRQEGNWFPGDLDKWMYQSIVDLSIKLGKIPAAGGVMIGGNILRKEIYHRRLEYRIDIENLRGHNLRR